MSVSPSEPIELDLEKDLADVLSKHGLDKRLNRYLIRTVDAFRESHQEINDDDIRKQGSMGSETPTTGN